MWLKLLVFEWRKKRKEKTILRTIRIDKDLDDAVSNNGPNTAGTGVAASTISGAEATSSSSTGGAQSSCSSSSATGLTGATVNSASTSKPGHCP
jgi:hypothetical protein